MNFVRNVLHILGEGCINSEQLVSGENTLDFPKYFVCFSRGSWKVGNKGIKVDEREEIKEYQLSRLKNNEDFVYFKV
jgi:hypothetical protein